MAVWTEEEIAEVGNLMRKGLSLLKIYDSGFRPQAKSDKYGFRKLAVGEKSDLFSPDAAKSIYNMQNRIHRSSGLRFSVRSVDNQLQIDRIK